MELISPERSLEENCKPNGSSYADEQHDNLVNGYTCEPVGSIEHHADAPIGETLADLAGSFSDIASMNEQSNDFVNSELQNSVMRSNPASPVYPLKQYEPYLNDESHEDNGNVQTDVSVYCSERQQHAANYEAVNLTEAEARTQVFSDSGRLTYPHEPKNDDRYIVSSILLNGGDINHLEENTRNVPYVENVSHYAFNLLERENLGESLRVSCNKIANTNSEKICEPCFDSPQRIVEHCPEGTTMLPSEEVTAMEKTDVPLDRHTDEQVSKSQLSSLKTSPSMQNSLSSPASLSVVPNERSSDIQQSDKEPESCTKDEKEVAHPCSPAGRTQSRSPDRSGASRKRAPSHDQRSSPKKQKSPSRKVSARDSRRKDDSPRRGPRSPQRRDSLHRRPKSSSRSPLRRRDSSRSRRDHRHGRSRSRSRSPRSRDHRHGRSRSRSRSPRSRDHRRRSPRRDHPSRHRSPPSSSRSHQHSPRRPWSPPANRKTGIGKPGRNLFVAGFSYATNERDLEKKFSKYGRVTDARVVRDKRSGDSRGFGFLTLEKDEDADAAIRALDETEWNGRIILVEKSKTGGR